MTLSLLDLLVLSMAAWRMSYMLVREAGPFNLIEKFRTKTTLGGILKCTYCTSIWVGIVLLLLWHTPLQAIVYIPAISAGGLMLASWTGANHPQ